MRRLVIAFTRGIRRLIVAVAGTASTGRCEDRADVVAADFETADWGDWRVVGDAFGSRPASGSLPGQQDVSGFRGAGFANSYHGRDGSKGELLSPEFVLSRKHVSFLMGGGRLPGEVGVELLLGDRRVRTATGPESETLHWHSWDVGEFAGKKARLRVFDEATGVRDKPNWECPDLFELPIEGEPGATQWVLEVDIGNGAVAGGSGGEYFIGTFDGTHFRPEESGNAENSQSAATPPWWRLPASSSPPQAARIARRRCFR